MSVVLKLYAVKNYHGKYFRAKGMNGYGDTWVDSLSDAKIYTKESQAKARVTWFANNGNGLPVPTLIELNVTEVTEIDQRERVKKAQRKAKS